MLYWKRWLFFGCTWYCTSATLPTTEDIFGSLHYESFLAYCSMTYSLLWFILLIICGLMTFWWTSWLAWRLCEFSFIEPGTWYMLELKLCPSIWSPKYKMAWFLEALWFGGFEVMLGECMALHTMFIYFILFTELSSWSCAIELRKFYDFYYGKLLSPWVMYAILFFSRLGQFDLFTLTVGDTEVMECPRTLFWP